MVHHSGNKTTYSKRQSSTCENEKYLQKPRLTIKKTNSYISVLSFFSFVDLKLFRSNAIDSS